MHPLTEKLLLNRGIVERTAQEEFLYPDYVRDVRDPFLILNMDKAVSRIVEAMEKGEDIVIFGDYDCDGIPGSVVLHDFFVRVGYEQVKNYIPHRHKEGYGLSVAAVEKFVADGVSLLVTVDCGIADVDAVRYAREHHMDVIITDHHIPGDVLPEAYTILNSKLEDDTYHDDMLCGAGVAFKLVQALLTQKVFSDVSPGYEKWLLDMVGIATIADMVPLVKENRALAYFGLKVLRKSQRPGLQALLKEAKIDQRYLSEDDVGFSIAPRINAASRMADPLMAFHMLSSTDDENASAFARELERLNTSRKQLTKNIVKEAHEMLKEKLNLHVLVVGKEDWPVGIAGIIAAQLSEHYSKPVFVWCKEEGATKGSCRSDGTVSVFDLMHTVEEGLFSARGGHEAAGGFTLEEGVTSRLEEALQKAFRKLPKGFRSVEEYVVDAELQLRDVNQETWNAVSALAPFGEGNPKPLFAFKGVRVTRALVFGKTKEHLKVTFEDESGSWKEGVAWFRKPEDYQQVSLREHSTVTLVAHIEESRFAGRVELRLRIKDILPYR